MIWTTQPPSAKRQAEADRRIDAGIGGRRLHSYRQLELPPPVNLTRR